MSGYPEPPLVGSETDTLVGSLERMRATFAHKCAELDAAGLRMTVGASTVTLGGLLKHLAYMEDINFTGEVAGRELPEPWASMPADGRSEVVWRSAADDSPETLYRQWNVAVARSRSVLREVLATADPGMTYTTGGEPGTIRRLLVDFVEEYGRHTGHADLIREAVDGRVGEDPPGRPYPFSIDG